MYSRERREIPKAKKSHRNTPSFSSSLLDEICRSIDNKPEPQTASLSKVEKWIENDRTVFRRRPRCDNTVFPDTFTANYPRPIRTGDRYLFGDYEEQERNIASTENLIKSKSKSRAMRIYSNLKKMKQPISPGARLTTFLSSIFNRNKTKGGHPAAPPANTKSPSKFAGGIEVEINKDALPRARPPLPPNAFQNGNYTFEEDAISESSSDLFELDHSSLFGIRDSFCQDLPVYQTTSFHQNRPLFR